MEQHAPVALEFLLLLHFLDWLHLGLLRDHGHAPPTFALPLSLPPVPTVCLCPDSSPEANSRRHSTRAHTSRDPAASCRVRRKQPPPKRRKGWFKIERKGRGRRQEEGERDKARIGNAKRQASESLGHLKNPRNRAFRAFPMYRQCPAWRQKL